jgi:hypothetical protein
MYAARVHGPDLINRFLSHVGDCSDLFFGHPNEPGRPGAATPAPRACEFQAIFVPGFVHAIPFPSEADVSITVL